jgi:hypothetical protein
MATRAKDDLKLVPYTYSFCRQCDARVELGRIAFGASVTCPACGSCFTIDPPQQVHDGAGQGRGEEAEPRQSAWDAAGGGSLARLFFAGTFTLPLRPDSLWPTLTLCFNTIVLVGAVRLGAWCFNADSAEFDRATRLLLANGLMFSLAFGSVVLVAWSFLASAYGMAILRETAQGVDAVKDWPNVFALEDLGEIVYVANSLVLASLPGAAAIPIWNRFEVPLPWAIGASIVVLFPILLLSMLAADSPSHPLSLPVWKSLGGHWPAWLGFHITTCAIGAAAVATEIALRRQTGWVTEVLVSGVVLAAAWMIYFRLLGRLASRFIFHSQVGV